MQIEEVEQIGLEQHTPCIRKSADKRRMLCVALLTFILVTSLSAPGQSTKKADALKGEIASTATVNSKSFMNSPAGFTGVRAEHYVDFSFDYPSSWQLDPQTGKPEATNYVEMERAVQDGANGAFTLESFNVGPLWYSDRAAADPNLMPGLVARLSTQLSTDFPEYKKVSEGAARINSYDGYEFRFTSMFRGTPKGDVALWGRVVILRGGSVVGRGVTLTMLATSLAPEIKGVGDVGVRSEIPSILKSFKLGPSTR